MNTLIPKSKIKRVPVEKGESIEEMLRRCLESKEPIEATAPMVYTEEKDGVLPQYDIRADRFDLALEAVDKYNATQVAKGQEAPKPEEGDAPPQPEEKE